VCAPCCTPVARWEASLDPEDERSRLAHELDDDLNQHLAFLVVAVFVLLCALTECTQEGCSRCSAPSRPLSMQRIGRIKAFCTPSSCPHACASGHPAPAVMAASPARCGSPPRQGRF
jgi:hypothetical protein